MGRARFEEKLLVHFSGASNRQARGLERGSEERMRITRKPSGGLVGAFVSVLTHWLDLFDVGGSRRLVSLLDHNDDVDNNLAGDGAALA